MNQSKPQRVELHQGNPTVGRLMRRALVEAGFEVVDDPGDGELAALLVVDVDSGLESLDERQQAYRQADYPVLISGVRASRDLYAEANWLERPFAPGGFVAQCQGLMARRRPHEQEPAAKEPGQPDSSAGDADAAGSLDSDSTPQTQRLSNEDAERLEEQLGLEKGVLSHADEDPPADDDAEDSLRDAELPEDDSDASLGDTDNLGPDEGPEFLEFDSSASIELEVDDLEDVDEGVGGSIHSAIEREQFSEDELAWKDPPRQAPEPLRNPSLNQTMPDAPAAMAPQGLFDEPADPASAGVSRGSSAPQLPPELERHIEGAAKLLAQSWGRIGLAARARDRADHIQRVLRAVLHGGVNAAAAQIERIPGADGFSGDLAVVSLVELLEVVRTLELRGRLEVSTADDDFVLYVDGAELEDIENLSGSDDRRLLEMLLEMGSITTELFDDLAASLDSELATPLQMQLRQDGLVSAADVKRARRHRARRLFDQLCGAEQGNFAFMDAQKGTGHAWPVDALALDLTTLLGTPARQDSQPRGATAPPGLQVDEGMPATIEVPDAKED
ncbi:MAG: DUF4388 domain-containing protein [Persicimonas sp.]